MRLSIWPNAANTWDTVVATASHAEATGWDGVWMADHFMPGSGDRQAPANEALTYIAGLAAVVPRVRLGTLVCGNTYRHPAVLAKQAATIDQISGGGMILGLGSGWQEREHLAYGIPFRTVKQRMDMFEEACELIKTLSTHDLADFNGDFYQLHDAPLSPRPVRGALPLLVGGGGEQRTLRIAAKYADEWNTWGKPDVLTHKMAVLERHCEAVGRDPSTIQRSAQVLLFVSDDPSVLARMRERKPPNPAAIGTTSEIGELLHAYAEAGVDEFIVRDETLGAEREERFDAMDRIREVATAASESSS